MDFELSNEQKDIKKAAFEFAEGEFDKDLAMELDEKGEFPVAIWKKASRLGFIGIHFPEQFGGQGYGAVENAIVVEEFCRKDSGIGVSLGLADFGSEIILRQGSSEQQERFLPLISGGKAISSVVFPDTRKGLEVKASGISARRVGDYYIVNGEKEFVLNNSLADLILVVCPLVESLASDLNMVALILEKGWNGLVITKSDKVGLKMLPWGRLNINNLKVPRENVVGQEDQKHFNIQGFCDESNIEIAAQALGMAQGALDRALDYAKKREAFGRPIGQFQSIQHYLANMYTAIELARLMTYKAAFLQSKGLRCHVEGNLAKLAASEAALYATSRGMEIMAGHGYMMEHEMQRFWRDAKLFEFAPITNEIVQNFLGESLGLPSSY